MWWDVAPMMQVMTLRRTLLTCGVNIPNRERQWVSFVKKKRPNRCESQTFVEKPNEPAGYEAEQKLEARRPGLSAVTLKSTFAFQRILDPFFGVADLDYDPQLGYPKSNMAIGVASSRCKGGTRGK